MKKLIVFGVLALTACGTPKIPGYDGPKALEQSQVASMSRTCINTRMKPQIIYLTQKTDFGTVLVPVDVHCENYIK
jgi:hypothetical protein